MDIGTRRKGGCELREGGRKTGISELGEGEEKEKKGYQKKRSRRGYSFHVLFSFFFLAGVCPALPCPASGLVVVFFLLRLPKGERRGG